MEETVNQDTTLKVNQAKFSRKKEVPFFYKTLLQRFNDYIPENRYSHDYLFCISEAKDSTPASPFQDVDYMIVFDKIPDEN